MEGTNQMGSAKTEVEMKAPNVIINKMDDVINQLEGVFPMLTDSIDRLGGNEGPSPEGKPMDGPGLPHVQGESALLTMSDKVDRIKRFAADYERQISRLNRLI